MAVSPAIKAFIKTLEPSPHWRLVGQGLYIRYMEPRIEPAPEAFTFEAFTFCCPLTWKVRARTVFWRECAKALGLSPIEAALVQRAADGSLNGPAEREIRVLLMSQLQLKER